MKGYEFPYRLDHLGRSKGENSYYAVVHADANNMGNRFKEYGESSKSNCDYFKHRVSFAVYFMPFLNIFRIF